jgi:predicted transcriptional regulator
MKLSKTEEELMRHIWRLQKASLKELLECYPDPKPANTTIATLLKRMYDKGCIDYQTIGKARQYFPLVKETDYVSNRVEGIVENFFGNSASRFASFFTKSSDMTKEELETLKRIIENEIDKK